MGKLASFLFGEEEPAASEGVVVEAMAMGEQEPPGGGRVVERGGASPERRALLRSLPSS